MLFPVINLSGLHELTRSTNGIIKNSFFVSTGFNDKKSCNDLQRDEIWGAGTGFSLNEITSRFYTINIVKKTLYIIMMLTIFTVERLILRYAIVLPR